MELHTRKYPYNRKRDRLSNYRENTIEKLQMSNKNALKSFVSANLFKQQRNGEGGAFKRKLKCFHIIYFDA